jgi:hypothetical protein
MVGRYGQPTDLARTRAAHGARPAGPRVRIGWSARRGAVLLCRRGFLALRRSAPDLRAATAYAAQLLERDRQIPHPPSRGVVDGIRNCRCHPNDADLAHALDAMYGNLTGMLGGGTVSGLELAREAGAAI